MTEVRRRGEQEVGRLGRENERLKAELRLRDDRYEGLLRTARQQSRPGSAERKVMEQAKRIETLRRALGEIGEVVRRVEEADRAAPR
jgi:hypothetical protein